MVLMNTSVIPLSFQFLIEHLLWHQFPYPNFISIKTLILCVYYVLCVYYAVQELLFGTGCSTRHSNSGSSDVGDLPESSSEDKWSCLIEIVMNKAWNINPHSLTCQVYLNKNPSYRHICSSMFRHLQIDINTIHTIYHTPETMVPMRG